MNISDPFFSANQRLGRAKEHVSSFGKQTATFINSKPWAHVVEPDDQGINQLHKIFPELPANRTCRGHGDTDVNDPDVWSGRALQESFVDLADVRSCINVSGL